MATTRRANTYRRPTGTIRPRGLDKAGRNVWQIITSKPIDGLPGTRTRPTLTIHGTRAEAEAELLNLLRNTHNNQLPSADGNLTLHQAMERWHTDNQATWEPSYADTNRSHVNVIGASPLGTIPIRKLTPEALSTQYRLWQKTFAGSTIATKHEAIRSTLSYATTNGWIPTNPALHAKIPRYTKHPHKEVLDANQLQAYLDACEHHAYGPALAILATTGMRRSEMIALEDRHIHLSGPDTGSASIVAKAYKRKGPGTGHHIGPPKTEHSRRNITLSRVAIAWIHRQRAIRSEWKLQSKGTFEDSGALFCREDGSRLLPSCLTRAHASIMANASLSGITIRNLRHTYATLLLTAGVHPKIVQEILGHSSIQITLDIYSEVLPTMQLGAAALADQLLHQPLSPHPQQRTSKLG